MIIHNPILTGSFTVNGTDVASITSSAASITALNAYTASQDILNGTYTLTSSFAAQTASFTAFTSSVNTFTASQNILNGTYATTGSNTFTGVQTVNSNLVVTGSITAQTLVVQTITSSVDFVTGSTRFGSLLDNTHVFSGSVTMNPGGLFVSGSGSVLIGSTSPAGTEKFGVTRDDGVTDGLHTIADFNKSGSASAELILGYYASGSAVTGPVVYAANGQPLLFAAGGVERMRLTATGNLGLGVTPSAWGSSFKAFEILGGSVFSTSTQNTIFLQNAYNDGSGFKYTTTDNATQHRMQNGDHIWYNAPSGTAGAAITFVERMRITSAGQIGINTSSPVSTSLTGSLTIYKAYNADGASVPSTTAQTYYGSQHGLYLFGRNSGLSIISANSEEGSIKFGNASTPAYATIATSTGTSAVGGDMYFKVGSDTERMRITSGGEVLMHSTTFSSLNAGQYFGTGGDTYFTTDTSQVLYINRKGNDGTLVDFRRDNSVKGSISVSGETVNYVSFLGSHWSQLTDNSKPEILKGTILEAIDELCTWEGETNDRLPKVKISDTIESKNVYGIFLDWDNDDTVNNDMYVAAVGAGYIRVNSSQDISIGDLLQSNGDGTAKIQSDDIMRSSTIAKVVSTNKIETYEDGSYLVAATLHCG